MLFCSELIKDRFFNLAFCYFFQTYFFKFMTKTIRYEFLGDSTAMNFWLKLSPFLHIDFCIKSNYNFIDNENIFLRHYWLLIVDWLYCLCPKVATCSSMVTTLSFRFVSFLSSVTDWQTDQPTIIFTLTLTLPLILILPNFLTFCLNSLLCSYYYAAAENVHSYNGG